MSPDSRDLADYEDYIRRELPRLVRSNIEEVARRDMQPIEASLVSNLVGIIQDCQDRVFRSYREAQNLGGDIDMPQNDERIELAPPALLASTESGMSGQLLTCYPEHSQFVDTVFEPPLPQDGPETAIAMIESNTSPSGFYIQYARSDITHSDSGYASERFLAGDENTALNPNTVSSTHETGTADVDWIDLNRLNFIQPWSQGNSMGGHLNWGSGA